MWGKVLHACVCVGEGAVSAGVYQPWLCLVKAADFRGGGGREAGILVELGMQADIPPYTRQTDDSRQDSGPID
jgi:hypothetical protein